MPNPPLWATQERDRVRISQIVKVLPKALRCRVEQNFHHPLLAEQFVLQRRCLAQRLLCLAQLSLVKR
jgi:hypothetical protein